LVNADRVQPIAIQLERWFCIRDFLAFELVKTEPSFLWRIVES